MKVRESGMPNENIWSPLFDTDLIIREMMINEDIESIVEFGCGFGTFTIPIAQLVKGKVYAFDIDEKMVSSVRNKLNEYQLHNVILEQRDLLNEGTGLPPESIEYVMLFNILHHENPELILQIATEMLKKGGKIGVIHWRSDIETPRGPDLAIRPLPEQIIQWAQNEKLEVIEQPVILKPYHFGIVLKKK